MYDWSWRVVLSLTIPFVFTSSEIQIIFGLMNLVLIKNQLSLRSYWWILLNPCAIGTWGVYGVDIYLRIYTHIRGDEDMLITSACNFRMFGGDWCLTDHTSQPSWSCYVNVPTAWMASYLAGNRCNLYIRASQCIGWAMVIGWNQMTCRRRIWALSYFYRKFWWFIFP